MALCVRRREFVEAEDLVAVDRGPDGAIVDEYQLMVRFRMQLGAGQRQDSPPASPGPVDSEELQLRTPDLMRLEKVQADNRLKRQNRVRLTSFDDRSASIRRPSIAAAT